MNICSGWNSESSPQQQSPSNNQQIPTGSLPQQQHNNSSRGDFRGNNRFVRGGRGRGNSNNNWNPHVVGQQAQAPPSVGLLQNPPPNLNKPPPKMVSIL